MAARSLGMGKQVFVRSRTGFPLRGDTGSVGHRIAWGFSISHAATKDGYTVRFSAWALRTDPPAPAARILLLGTSGPAHVVEVSERRMDVMRALSIAAGPTDSVGLCGFRGEFATGEEALEVIIEGDSFSAAIGRVDFSPPGVVEGQDGWLFLAEDANDCISQHSTDWQPDAAWLRQWQDYFSKIRSIPAGKVAFLIAPAKEAVMPERHPIQHRARTPITHLLPHFSDRIIFPLAELRADCNFSYDRTDTHWTDYGARIACEAMLARIGEAVPDIPERYAVRQKHGDLGNKLVPTATDRRLCAAWPNESRLVFDNHALHHGNIRIHANAAAPLKKTILIWTASISTVTSGSAASFWAKYRAFSWSSPTRLDIFSIAIIPAAAKIPH